MRARQPSFARFQGLSAWKLWISGELTVRGGAGGTRGAIDRDVLGKRKSRRVAGRGGVSGVEGWWLTYRSPCLYRSNGINRQAADSFVPMLGPHQTLNYS